MQTIDPPVDLRSWTDPNDGALQTLTTSQSSSFSRNTRDHPVTLYGSTYCHRYMGTTPKVHEHEI